MNNILILFDSDTGNTQKMAELVAEGAKQIPKTEVRTCSVDTITLEDFKWAEGIALGSPTHYGTISWKLKKWFDELPGELWGTQDGKIGCAFSSSGAWGGGAELTCMTLMTMLINYGFLVFGVTDYVGKKFSPHYGSIQAGEPREEYEKESSIRLGRRLAEWVAVFHHGEKSQDPTLQTYPRFEHRI
jgi:NAD(P)H dehydrogenase (quinone)